MPPSIYVEYLANIHVLSINIDFGRRELSSEVQKFSLSEDGTKIWFQDPPSRQRPISIPAHTRVFPDQISALKPPTTPSRYLTYRVQLTPLSDSSAIERLPNVAPWSAPELTENTSIRCRGCNSLLLERGVVKVWKDLPTEGWAEMMEFWHCHKPDEPEMSDQPSKKGYAASSQLDIQPGIGLVSPSTILFHEGDIVVDTDAIDLQCERCKLCIGYRMFGGPARQSGEENLRPNYRHREGAYVYKHAIAVSTKPDQEALSMHRESWPAVRLLEAMENQGVRKFVINVRGSEAERRMIESSMLVWIFAPELAIGNGNDLMPVMKVLYKDFKRDADRLIHDDDLTKEALSTGSIEMSQEEAILLHSCLDPPDHCRTSIRVPEDMKAFQDWQVGLLARFAGGEQGTDRSTYGSDY